jgi:hypothetical protein
MKTETFLNSKVIWAVAATALFVGGCQNKAEQAAERQADALEDQADSVRAAAEREADRMEEQADRLDPALDGIDSPAEQRIEKSAAATREQAEREADRLEDQADAVRDGAR